MRSAFARGGVGSRNAGCAVEERFQLGLYDNGDLAFSTTVMYRQRVVSDRTVNGLGPNCWFSPQ